MADQPKYDPNVRYEFTVSWPVRIGSFKYLPRDTIAATGDLLNQLVEKEGANVIRSARSV